MSWPQGKRTSLGVPFGTCSGLRTLRTGAPEPRQQLVDCEKHAAVFSGGGVPAKRWVFLRVSKWVVVHERKVKNKVK